MKGKRYGSKFGFYTGWSIYVLFRYPTRYTVFVNTCESIIYIYNCGERGIRTPGGVTLNGFQDRRIRPLCHLSEILKNANIYSIQYEMLRISYWMEYIIRFFEGQKKEQHHILTKWGHIDLIYQKAFKITQKDAPIGILFLRASLKNYFLLQMAAKSNDYVVQQNLSSS